MMDFVLLGQVRDTFRFHPNRLHSLLIFSLFQMSNTRNYDQHDVGRAEQREKRKLAAKASDKHENIEMMMSQH